MSRSTAVIGAGPAGCLAAHLLQRAGRKVVLFEKAPVIGGRTTSWHEQGWVVDSGAGFFTNFYPNLKPLLSRLGLSDEVVQLSRSNSLTDGRAIVDFTLGSVMSFARFKFLSPAEKLRLALQTALIAVKYHNLKMSDPETLASLDDLSIKEDAIARVGENAYHFMVRPGIEPFWYFSCDVVSRALMLALQAQAVTARFFAFHGGMNVVCQRLAEGLEARTSTAVTGIAQQGTRFVIQTADKSELFDEVVVATTGTAASQLCASLDHKVVPKMIAHFLSTQSYVPNVHAAFLVNDRSKIPNMGALFPCGPGQNPVAAINFNSFKNQKRPKESMGQEIVSIFLSANESRAVRGLGKEELFKHAWTLGRRLCPHLPESAEPLQLIQRDEAIPVHAVGRYRMAAEVHKQQRGPVVFAGDYLTCATVDGALRSGAAAVRALGIDVPSLDAV
jgi:predicted NAD/FAD-dependent oxidoreductase